MTEQQPEQDVLDDALAPGDDDEDEDEDPADAVDPEPDPDTLPGQ